MGSSRLIILIVITETCMIIALRKTLITIITVCLLFGVLQTFQRLHRQPGIFLKLLLILLMLILCSVINIFVVNRLTKLLHLILPSDQASAFRKQHTELIQLLLLLQKLLLMDTESLRC